MASPTNVKIPKVTQYVRNVGRSVAFASIGVIGNQMPGVKGFIEDNDEVFRDVYHSVKNYKETIRNINKAIQGSNLYKAVEFGAKNIVEDAKSGNFYNKSRSTENAENILGLEDDMDFDYEVDEGSSNTTYGSKYLANSFDEAIGAAAIGTTTAVAKGTDIIVRSNKASTTMISSQIEKSTATLHSGIGAVYNAVNVVNTFLAGPMTAHLENSRKYYDNSLKIMQEQHAMIREMLEMQRNLYKAQDRTRSVSKIDQIMDYNGVPDLKAYKDVVKGNIEGLLDAHFGMFRNSSGINIPMAIAASPFMLLFEGLAENSMPKSIKRNLENIDSSFMSIFPNLIARLSNGDFALDIKKKRKSIYEKAGNKILNTGDDDNDDIDSIKKALKSVVGSIFGIKIEKKNSINTSNYVKGAVPFDGITRKTIVEVIPGYLARIEAALTGSRERHYDPHNGTWRSIDEIDESFKSEKAKAIQMGNRDVIKDIYSYRNRLDPDARKSFDKSIQKMLTRIFDDSGSFDPGLITEMSPEYTKDGKRVRHISDSTDYKKYGFRSKEEFETVLSQLSNKTIQNLAMNNLRARQNYSRKLEQQEIDGGTYNLLFNGAYDTTGKGSTKKMDTSVFVSRNPLAAMTDAHGKNVFYYLREILNGINNRWRSREKTSVGGNYSYTTTSEGYSTSREYSTASESEGDSGSDSDDDDDTSAWYRAEEDVKRETKKKREEQENKEKVLNFASEKFNKSPLGKFFGKSIGNISHIFAKPIEFANELLEKANENVFSLMFGNKELKDETGKPIDNILEYMINKVKTSFDELGKWIKSKFKGYFTSLWEKIQPKAQPVIDELKSMGRAAKARVGTAFKRTFDPAVNAILDRLPANVRAKLTRNEVVPTEEIVEENARQEEVWDYEPFQADDEDFYDNIVGTDARGRVVRKRGLTMISPGEIIIPASFNKKDQNKMLAMEKRDRSKILKAIGLNAEGNVDTEQIKRNLHNIYEENKGTNKSARTTASAIVGGGAGLLLGHPLIGAIAGAGISILNNSDTLKKIVFGEDIDGEHREGLISKKIQDKFKTVLPDMGDYGIVGGVLGLLTPFGPLAGAAIGAGIGYLKHSEGFKKFIFGDEATGEEGLISEEAYKKFKEHVKKAAPNMLLGAVGGILAGPFGLLGNAALGAGVGLLSSTEGFHKFIFGDPEAGKGGVLDAFKTGFLDPAKDKFIEFLADFKGYAKRNIIEPMKDFWKPVNRMLKNTITGVGEKIGDFVNDMFERTVGLPLHDFLQEKIFKPVSKLVFGILKAPYTLAKGIIATPFRAAQFIGNSMTAADIRKGKAYDMSASERLQWRDQHKARFSRFNPFNQDAHLKQDRQLAEMDLQELTDLAMATRASVSSYAGLQRETGVARKAVGEAVSGFFNTKDETGKNRFNRVGYNKVKKIAEYAQTGDADPENLANYIDSLNLNLTEEEKQELINTLKPKMEEANRANKTMGMAKTSSKELDRVLTEKFGKKIKGRNKRRQIYKNAEAELAARRKAAVRDDETPEVSATNNLAQIITDKSKTLIELHMATNKYLADMLGVNKKDTTPPSDKESNDKKKIQGEVPVIASEQQDTSILDQANKEINKKNKKHNNIFKGAFGKIAGWLGFGGNAAANIDEDSKEAKDAEKLAEEKEKNEKENTNANKEQVSVLTSIKEALVGSKEDPEKKGILGKLWGGLGKVGKWLGIGALTIGGVALYGHASEWFKTAIWPKLKTLIFGTKDADGNVINKGLAGYISDGLKTFAFGENGDGGVVGSLKKFTFGEDGNGGVVGKIRGFIFGTTDENGNTVKKGLINTVKDFFIGDPNNPNDGFKGWIKEGLEYAFDGDGVVISGIRKLLVGDKNNPYDGLFGSIKGWIEGQGGAVGLVTKITEAGVIAMSYAFNKFLPPIISVLLNNAPKLIGSLVNGIIAGITLSRNKKNKYKQTIDVNNTIAEIQNTTSSSLDGVHDEYGIMNSIKSVFASTPSASTEPYTIDFSTISSNYDENGNRTNEVFDEEGNLINDDWAVDNEIEGAGEKVARSGIRSFVKGLYSPNSKSAKMLNVADDVANAAKSTVKPGWFTKIKGVGSAATAAAKTTVNGINVVKNTGTAVRNGIDNHIQNSLKKESKEACEKIVSNYIIDFFDRISNEKTVISLIANTISKSTKKEITEEAIEKSIKELGEKAAKHIVKRVGSESLEALGTYLTFGALKVIVWIGDFLYGYNNAYTLFNILDGGRYVLSGGEKILAGMINMLNNEFVFGGLIPTELWIDLLVEWIAPWLKIDTSKLQEARDFYDQDLYNFNKVAFEEGGETYDNLEDANNRNKWWTKLKKGLENQGVVTTDILSNINQYQTTGTINPVGFGRDLSVSISNAINSGKGRKKKLFGKANSSTVSETEVVSSVLGKVKNSILSYNNKIKKGISEDISNINKNKYNILTNALNVAEGHDSTLGSTASTTMTVASLYTSAVSMLNTAIENTESNLISIISKWSSAKSAKKTDDNKISRALKGTLSVFSTSYWNTNDLSSMGIMGNIVTVQTLIEKVINTPVAVMHDIVNTMTKSLESIKSVFNSDLKDIWEWVENFFITQPSTSKTTTTTTKRTTTKTGVVINNGFGRGRKFGKAHIYQSGAVADIPYGDSTIGDAGCAPVAATNLLNSLGISSSLGDAATFAEANGMTVRGGGTDIDYFNHYLGSKGIATKSTNSRNDVMNALRNGDQVVMLGRDSTDGYGTPFGTDPHFVTAKGISKSGNIIAEDPDLPDQYVEYKPGKMMNSMISSVIADTGMGRNRKRFSRGKYGLGAEEVAMLDEYRVTSTFDEPRSNSSGRHGALDLVKYNNAPIYAFTNGTVKYTESRYAPDSGHKDSSDGDGFGNYVTLVDDNNYYHTYAHMNGVYVSPGQTINRGDQLGIQGHTGRSSGSHLHYQVAYGSVVGTKQNPRTYLQNYTSSSSYDSSHDNSAYWGSAEDSYNNDYYYDDSSSNNSSSSSSSSDSYSSESTTTTTSTKPTLFSALTNLGKSVARYLYGDAYDTIHGFSDTNTTVSNSSSPSYDSSSSDSSNNNYYDDNEDDYYDDSSSGSSDSSSSNSSSNGSTSTSTTNNTSTMQKTYITSLMWKKLRHEYGLTEAGAAGMMGNINCESGYEANNLQDSQESRIGMDDTAYTNAVNNKTYSKSKFINDGAGYGYAQWTSSDRKKKMYESIVENGRKIDAPIYQLEFLNSELTSNYSGVGNTLKTTNNVNTASDKVLYSYEIPQNPEATKEKRRNYSWAVYNTYKGTGRSDANLYKYKTGSAAKTLNDMSRTANVINNNYYGSARDVVDYATFLKTIVEILVTISNNTSMLNKIVEILSSKFDITIDPNEVKSAATNANTRAQAERKINEMIESNNNLADKARILNNKDTSYLLSAMTAIAAE